MDRVRVGVVAVRMQRDDVVRVQRQPATELRKEKKKAVYVCAKVGGDVTLSSATFLRVGRRGRGVKAPKGGGVGGGKELQTWAASLPSREVLVCYRPSNSRLCFEINPAATLDLCDVDEQVARRVCAW